MCLIRPPPGVFVSGIFAPGLKSESGSGSEYESSSPFHESYHEPTELQALRDAATRSRSHGAGAPSRAGDSGPEARRTRDGASGPVADTNDEDDVQHTRSAGQHQSLGDGKVGKRRRRRRRRRSLFRVSRTREARWVGHIPPLCVFLMSLDLVLLRKRGRTNMLKVLPQLLSQTHVWLLSHTRLTSTNFLVICRRKDSQE